ncbi:MAG: hypothetical protein MJ082_04080 [Clostridia bacterium]|nr:hypothetical protein [Clostridia bacterium]
MKSRNIVLRLFVYLIGLAVIAVGINLSKLSALGISPVSSIPGVLSARFPQFSLGSMVILVYCLLVAAQAIVLRKEFKLVNILGVPVAIVFGWLVDFVGVSAFRLTLAGLDLGIDREFHGLMAGIAAPQTLFGKICVLLVSIAVIALGVCIYLRPKLVPMPAEGLAAAFAGVWKKPFGNCKTGVDFTMIFIAFILQVVLLGGFAPIFNGTSVVGAGTLLSALLVGQTVKFLNTYLFKFSQKKEG